MAGQRAFVGALLFGMVVTASAASAETVPLPTPAPLPKEGMPPPPAAAQGPLSGLKSLFNWNRPAEPEAPAAAPTTTTTAAFNPTQRAQVDKVSQYLSSVQQLSGNFVQVGPDGARVRGEFYIQKPGKVRFEYDPPTPIEIVADGQSVVVRNSKLATQDLYPLSQTPLRFLLSDRIDLIRDTNVIERPRRRRFRDHHHRGEAGADRHQPADDDGGRQGLSAQAMDGDRPAGLRHHGRGLQSRHQQAAGPEPVSDRLHAL